MATVRATLESPDQFPGLELEIRTPDTAAAFGLEDFEEDAVEPHRLTTPPLRVRRAGPVAISLVVVGDQESVEADAGFELDLGHAWKLQLVYSGADPTFECRGCVDAKSIAVPPDLRPHPLDSLWIVWIREDSGS